MGWITILMYALQVLLWFLTRAKKAIGRRDHDAVDEAQGAIRQLIARIRDRRQEAKSFGRWR